MGFTSDKGDYLDPVEVKKMIAGHQRSWAERHSEALKQFLSDFKPTEQNTSKAMIVDDVGDMYHSRFKGDIFNAITEDDTSGEGRREEEGGSSIEGEDSNNSEFSRDRFQRDRDDPD